MGGKRLATTLAQLAVTGATIALNSPTAHAGVGDLVGSLQSSVQGFGNLILLIALALLGSGLALRFLPTGSHRTKEAAGSLLDNALILAGLAAVGTYLIFFVGDWARIVTGEGGVGKPGGPWEPPTAG